MKYTIAISAYKGKFLKECIDSILLQTYTDFELIILNDASPDPILDIVKKYNDPRIRYYENERNIGAINVVDNWNKCLSLAKGEYYMQMGDDDCLDKNYLLEFEKSINENPQISVFHCRSYIIDEESNLLEITDALPIWESVFSAIYYRLKGRQQFISDFVYKTDGLRNHGGFYKLPLAWASDDLSSYIVSQKKGIVNIDKPIFRYRSNRYSITSSGNAYLKVKAINLAIEEIYQLLELPINNIETDNLLKKQIKFYLPIYAERQKAILLGHSLKNNSFRSLLNWLKQYTELGLTIKILLRALYYYTKG